LSPATFNFRPLAYVALSEVGLDRGVVWVEGKGCMSTVEIRPLKKSDRAWVKELISDHWGAEFVVTRGRIHVVPKLPGFVAVKDGDRVGLVTYHKEGEECELVTLDSLAEGIGVGSALVDAVKRAATAGRCTRLWLITTNDNLHAIRFYQKRDFDLVAVHRYAVRRSRKIKPQIPKYGIDGIPLQDEIEMELLL
jgi:ribosomal protein S18 acetylase RimI-like enzyme